jgi:predicted CoA-substrate-specific enzyme activase
MVVAGLDVGALTTKAVVMDGEGKIFGKALMVAHEEGDCPAEKTLEEALRGTGLSIRDLDCIVATGAGRKNVSFAHKQKSTQSCIAKGANFLHPLSRLVIDLGAESCIAVRLNEKGLMEDSVANDHCASGSGIFIDTMAKLMQMSIEEFARMSLEADAKAEVTSMCAVFAEQEVISHVHRDPPTPRANVIAGIHASIASRVMGFAKRLGVKPDVLLTGGVARNVGFVKIMEEALGMAVHTPAEPEAVAALGAALFAKGEKSHLHAV